MAQCTAERVNRVKSLLSLVIFLLIVPVSGLGQTHAAITVRMDGFFITIGKNIYIFQPSNDTNFLMSLKNNSFAVGTNNGPRNDLLEECTKDIGDSIRIIIKDTSSNIEYNEMCHYFYCEIELLLSVFDEEVTMLTQPSEYIWYKGMRYALHYNFIRNRTLKIVPKDKKDLLQLIENYKIRSYLPVWLKDLDK